MSIWSKLSALFRGAAHDGAQTVVDANALRILDQEIRDADAAQGKARDELAKLVARRRSLETEVAGLTDQIRKYEASARAAMGKGDQALALEVAQRIADLEKDATQKSTQMTELRAAEEKLRTVIAQTDTKVEALHRAIDIVPDQAAALEAAIELGFERVLTSGGALTAEAGAERIAELVEQAAGRIGVMAGAGVRPGNLASLIRRTGVREVHGSFGGPVPGADPASKLCEMGFAPPEPRDTSQAAVAEAVAVLRGLS